MKPEIIYRAKPLLKGPFLMAASAAMLVGTFMPWLTVWAPWMHVGMGISGMLWMAYATIVERFACENHNRLEAYRIMFKGAKVIESPQQLIDLADEIEGTIADSDCLKGESNGKSDTDSDQ